MKTMNIKEKKAVIIGAAALIAGTEILLLAVSCTAETGDGVEPPGIAVNNAILEELIDDLERGNGDGSPRSDPTTDNEPDADMNSAENAATSEAQPSIPQQNTARISNASGDPSASSSKSDNSNPSPLKHWVEGTQQIRVGACVICAERVPIYSRKKASIRNICGQDITGNTSAYAKAHIPLWSARILYKMASNNSGATKSKS